MARRFCVHQTGGPEVLQLEDFEVPEPGPGEVRIEVRAVGVNFIDTYFRSGSYPRPLPFTPGLEGAGRVDALGAGVDRLRAGDRVAWCSVNGSYADFVIAPVDALASIPDAVSEEVAAAAMLQGMTAHYLVKGVRDTAPGDTALVHAAAGGTGLLLVQMLKAAGAKVIGTCSTRAKAELVRDAGADEVVLYDDEDFAEAVARITEGAGVEVVYDSVGQTTFEGSLASLRPRGLLCLFGQSSGAVPPFDLQRLGHAGSVFVTRPSLFEYTARPGEFEMRSGEVLAAVAEAVLNVRIGARFPLAEAVEAHRALESRATTGKVLLLPDSFD